MDPEIQAARRNRMPWLTLGGVIGYLLAIGRAWILDDGAVPSIVLVGGAFAIVLLLALCYYVLIPRQVRKRRPGGRIEFARIR